MTLDTFHFDISGKDNNEVQPLNKELIFLMFIVFHFDISGIFNSDVHPLNI